MAVAESKGPTGGGGEPDTSHHWLRVVGNSLLQLLGDPRWWPRDLPRPRERLLWRTIKQAVGEWPPPDTPKGRTERLQALAEAQYDEAKLWFLLTAELYALSAAFAGAAFLIASARTALTFCAVACQITAALARIRAARLSAIAHEADWRALLLDSMGPTEEELTHAIAIENTLGDGARRRAGALPDYFTSTAEPGPRRLADNLRQMAFFTAALYGGAKVQAYFLASVVVIIPLTGPVYWLVTGTALPPQAGVLLVTAVLPLWDVIGRQVSWREASKTLDRVFVSLEHTNDVRDAMPLMADAMTATAMAPPIPRTIYTRWFKEGLKTRWEMVSERELPEAGGSPDPGTLIAETSGS